MLRLTLVTPVRNARHTVLQAIESVKDYKGDLEHLVFDACSIDGTSELLAAEQKVTLIREPDRGPHDAMNRALERLTGDVVGFLNADDRYEPRALARAMALFTADPELDIVVGGTRVFRSDELGNEHALASRMHRRLDGQDPWELALGAPGFNGRFFRRRVFEKIGGFSVELAICGDRDFLIRCAQRGIKSCHTGRISYAYRAHGGSKTLNGTRATSIAIAREHIAMIKGLWSAGRLPAGWSGPLKCLHAYESAKLVVSELLLGSPRASIGEALRAFGRSPAWPIHAIRARQHRKRVLSDTG